MAVCTRKQRKSRKVCIGQLNEQITLQDREIVSPVADGVAFGEDFTGDNVVWALVETVRGETIFDATNVERDISHKFYIRYITGITSETWIEYNDEKVDIVDVENLDERNDFLILRASRLGDKSKQVNLS